MEVGAFPGAWGVVGEPRGQRGEASLLQSATPLEVPACARFTLRTAGTTETPQDFEFAREEAEGLRREASKRTKEALPEQRGRPEASGPGEVSHWASGLDPPLGAPWDWKCSPAGQAQTLGCGKGCLWSLLGGVFPSSPRRPQDVVCVQPGGLGDGLRLIRHSQAEPRCHC